MNRLRGWLSGARNRATEIRPEPAASPSVANGRGPQPTSLDPSHSGAGFDQEILALGGYAHWLAGRRGHARHYVERTARDRQRLVAFASQCREVVAAAEGILRHEFDLLGTGIFVPDDTTRGRRDNGYRPIDWGRDPIRGLQFSLHADAANWDHSEQRPGSADIKLPWELSRCQHFLTLGQAFVLSGDRRYAQEILDQCMDFIEANPIGCGVNWVCTMDVALRALSMCHGLALIITEDAIRASELLPIHRHLYETAGFITQHLENRYEVTSNHYLSNVVGLLVVASEFKDLGAGAAWLSFARASIEEEIFKQVNFDGSDFESSIAYHRLVTELLFAAWQTAPYASCLFGESFRERLVAMFDFLAAVSRPDGRIPLVGDMDDGKVMLPVDYYGWDRRSVIGLLQAGSAALGLKRSLFPEAEEKFEFESLWWGVDTSKPARPQHHERDRVSFFPMAGFAVSRKGVDDSYLLVTNGPVGTRGFGNHKHNDLLSFEYFDRGVPVIVDPGSYVYTSDPAARNLFRSTEYHNAIRVDGEEQNGLRPEWLFRMFEQAEPEFFRVVSDFDAVVMEAAHRGYERLPGGAVRHHRRFDHNVRMGALVVSDTLSGIGSHEVEWFLHFDPELEIELIPGPTCAIARRDKGLRWRLTWPTLEVSPVVEASWNSPSYGVCIEARRLLWREAVALTGDHRTKFIIERHAA